MSHTMPCAADAVIPSSIIRERWPSASPKFAHALPTNTRHNHNIEGIVQSLKHDFRAAKPAPSKASHR